jgi:MIP family channel proteins
VTATAREALAEFLGTFVLILFGVGVVAQVTLGGGDTGQYVSINLAWGLAVTLGVYVSSVSGGHLNPAITVALATWRGFPWAKVAPYIGAQMAGAFVASAVVYLTYADALTHFDGGVRQVTGAMGTAGIWATYPQPWLSTLGGLVDQVVGTAALSMVVFALTDPRREPLPSSLVPILVGLLVAAIGMAYGLNAGYAINPARDFGPRLFTALAGWGGEVFNAGNGWWWVPIVGPVIGALLGGLSYNGLIGNRHPHAG